VYPKKLGKVIQIDEEQIREHLGNLVRGTVEETSLTSWGEALSI